MKDKRLFRPFYGIVCIIFVAFMVNIISARLPDSEINVQVNQIEQSIINKDWEQAKVSMEILKTIYNSNKMLIPGNNATEVTSTIDYIMRELNTLIQNEQDSALEYIRGLKSSLEY